MLAGCVKDEHTVPSGRDRVVEVALPYGAAPSPGAALGAGTRSASGAGTEAVPGEPEEGLRVDTCAVFDTEGGTKAVVALKDVWVLQFSGEELKKAQKVGALDAGSSVLTASLVEGVDQTVYMVANAGTADFSDVTGLTDFKGRSMDPASVASDADIPLVGVATGVQVVVQADGKGRVLGLNGGRILLKRILAKVVVNYDLKAHGLALSGFRHFGPKRAYFVQPEGDTYPDNANADDFGEVSVSVTGQTGTVAYYTPENVRGRVTSYGNNPFLKNAANAPANSSRVSFTAAYTTPPTGYQAYGLTFDFFLGGDAVYDYNVKRNTVYTVTAGLNGFSPSDGRVTYLNYGLTFKSMEYSDVPAEGGTYEIRVLSPASAWKLSVTGPAVASVGTASGPATPLEGTPVQVTFAPNETGNRKINIGFTVTFDDGSAPRTMYQSQAGTKALTVATSVPAEIGITSARVGGQVTDGGGGTVTARGIKWSDKRRFNPASEGTEVAAPAGGLGGFTVPLTGLTGGTPYYYAAYATNGAGTVYGPVLNFMTEKGLDYTSSGTGWAYFAGTDLADGTGAVKNLSWADAMAGGAGSGADGSLCPPGWRMPTRAEIMLAWIYKDAMPENRLLANNYWSSDEPEYWLVNLANGGCYLNTSGAGPALVRCVKDF